MFRDRRTKDAWVYWIAGVGTALGATAGVWWLRRRRRLGEGEGRRALGRLEARVTDALEQEGFLARRGIEVGALANGIVELTGRVRDEAEAERVVAVVQRVPGVRTVLNRMDTEILEEHLADVRRRNAERGPGERETHWTGFNVGMGMRRQGHETDPDRRDDKADIVSRELGVDRATELASEVLDKVAPGVTDHMVGPAAPTDRGRVADTSHRRLGNVPAEPIQDLHPESGIHENVKKGTDLTIREAGLDQELIERDLKDRS